MKIFRYLLISITLFISGHLEVLAQANKPFSPNETNFVRWFFKEHDNWPYRTPPKNQRRILYADGIYGQMIAKITEELSGDTIRANWENDNTQQNILVLNVEEKAYIKEQLVNMNSLRWGKHILPKSKTIARVLLDSLINNPQKQIKFYEKYSYGFYNFSKPIFIRNNSICIFYCGLDCGTLCADNRLIIFKRNAGKWEEYISVFRIIS